jgi:hypothetical protein
LLKREAVAAAAKLLEEHRLRPTRVLVRHGKKTEEEIQNGGKATIRQKLDDDKDYFRKARKHEEVRAIYLKIVSRTRNEPMP